MLRIPQFQGTRNFARRHRRTLIFVQAVFFVALGYLWARSLGGRDTAESAAQPDDAPAAIQQAADGPAAWTCSMHPQIRKPNPGSCPICGMDLIPVAKTAGGLRTLTVSPEARALMNIATAPVERKYVTHEIPMVGKVDYDETRFGSITAWVPGRLDRLFVDYTGVKVNKGDHMVSIYSEQLYAAQQELIEAARSAEQRPSGSSLFATGGVNLVESSREKLRLLGLTSEQIQEIERQDKPSDHLTIYAPMGGIVVDKLKQEGERVSLGERIYTIADLNLVWVRLDAYESDLSWIRYGQDVTVTTEAYPGETFHGRIAFIHPVLNDKTRTVTVRVNVPNPDGRLKPKMFVRATVRPRVAAGGRVMDPSLAGKWISPMHPEIVKDEPGKCDICGMPLVRAESLGYVTPSTDENKPPLVVPYSAALVTGTRAIVYVELPTMHTAAEPALQTLSAVVGQGKLEKSRDAFATYARMLDRPYDQPGTAYAQGLWNRFADELAQHALAGQRADTMEDAEGALAQIETTMNAVRERFALPGQPTYEGREIVLGPRAGDYYLVRHGLQEGELVVTQGNFKIDSEIQIQAKPSMMTPEGGGGGGHSHGGHGGEQPKAGEDAGHNGHKTALPAEFREQIAELQDAYKQVRQAIEEQDIGQATAAFAQFEQALNRVDGSLLTGHSKMLWNEFSMLLANDAVEGSDAEKLAEADRVYLLLKGHMRRMHEQMGLVHAGQQRPVKRIAVPQKFQAELARIWERYQALQKALAMDEFEETQRLLAAFESAVATVDDQSLTDRANKVWDEERANLEKLTASLKEATDIEALRAQFSPLSDEIGVLARMFGFGEAGPVYELHCPMAFQGRGAVWYQASDQVRNPYYGATMSKCADRVRQIVRDEPDAAADGEPHGGSHSDEEHSNH